MVKTPYFYPCATKDASASLLLNWPPPVPAGPANPLAERGSEAAAATLPSETALACSEK